MNPTTICVVTGTRAEYGLLRGLMEKIQGHEDIQLQVVATAMHLAEEYGLTYREIEGDGFVIDRQVHMLMKSDSTRANAMSVGIGTMGFADAFADLGPDAILVLGDRFEALAAAQTAMMLRIPVIHLHGGELTQGAMDDVIRHAITKFAHFHFVSTEAYGKRVVQLGENPSRVFNVGALGVEALLTIDLLSKDELAGALGFQLGDRNFLVTYHPVTQQANSAKQEVEELLAALDDFPRCKNIDVISKL